ncbi:MAG: hypothetical protein ACQCN4_08575 [Candidatus Bathyarchaeia archaeon]|jgi:hypothetical protein
MSQFESKTENDDSPVIAAVEPEAEVKPKDKQKSREDAKKALYLTRV